MEWGTPVQWGKFLLFSRSGGHKTKETYLTRPGSPTPCKQALRIMCVPPLDKQRPLGNDVYQRLNERVLFFNLQFFPRYLFVEPFYYKIPLSSVFVSQRKQPTVLLVFSYVGVKHSLGKRFRPYLEHRFCFIILTIELV